jgi:ectoine hydroxylase-related dioxygenase (phytanoyl-CoA dioxygenase family)
MLTDVQRAQYERDGYLVVSGLFSMDEVERYRDHFMAMRAQGDFPGDFSGVGASEQDPLKRYPRMIHMHRWDALSMQWMIDARLAAVMTDLLGRTPYAVQTMLYFKPPGARGQALHQDQWYLRVRPGTCMAAWMALDDCDEENGCMRLVPGSHTLPVLCTEAADLHESFTDVQVPLPEGTRVDPVFMRAGDVLFFNGSVIHGSLPNTTKDRFRRALIGHYVAGEAEECSAFYHPLHEMVTGREVGMEKSQGGGPCGVWREKDGRAVVELVTPAAK